MSSSVSLLVIVGYWWLLLLLLATAVCITICKGSRVVAGVVCGVPGSAWVTPRGISDEGLLNRRAGVGLRPAVVNLYGTESGHSEIQAVEC